MGQANYLGTDNGEVMLFSDTYAADAGENIVSQVVTARLNFVDKYPDLEDKFVTVQGVKLVYVDNGAFSVVGSVSIDGGENWSNNTQTIGTAGADGKIKSQTFSFTATGQYFNFKFAYTAATGVFHIVEIMAMINDAGEHMEL